MKAVRIVTLIVTLLVAPVLVFRAYTEYNLIHTLLGMAWGILAALSFIWVYVNRKPGGEINIQHEKLVIGGKVMKREELTSKVEERGIPKEFAEMAVAVTLNMVEEGLKTSDKVRLETSSGSFIIAERVK